jgi:hypothetical protein
VSTVEGDEGGEMNKLCAVVDTFTQGIERFVDDFTHSSCNSLTERSKESDAFLSASSSLFCLDFPGWLSCLQNCVTSRSYLVKTAMMGMSTIRTISHQSINEAATLTFFGEFQQPLVTPLQQSSPVAGSLNAEPSKEE